MHILNLGDTLRRRRQAATIDVHIHLAKLTKQMQNQLVKALETGLYQAVYGPGATLYGEFCATAEVPAMWIRKGAKRYGGGRWRLTGKGIPPLSLEKLNEFLVADFTAAQLDDNIKYKPKNANRLHSGTFHWIDVYTIESVDRIRECLVYTENYDYRSRVNVAIQAIKSGNTVKFHLA